MDIFRAQFHVINYFPCEKGFFTQPRVFDYPYLLYVHGGKGEYKIGSRRHSCEGGDLLFCPAWEENTIFADGEEPYILSGLEFTVSDGAFLNEHMPEKVNIRGNEFAEACIGKMIEEYLYERIYGGQMCSDILNAFLLEIFRMRTQNVAIKKRTDVQGILDYISKNIGKKLTCAELSDAFHYHKNTVNRLVKESTGQAVKEYILSMRIKEAKRYLLFTDKSVEEIASLLQYSSTAFFCLQFKEKTGQTPAKFRKRYGAGEE